MGSNFFSLETLKKYPQLLSKNSNSRQSSLPASNTQTVLGTNNIKKQNANTKKGLISHKGRASHPLNIIPFQSSFGTKKNGRTKMCSWQSKDVPVAVQNNCVRNDGVNNGIMEPFSSALTLDVTKDSNKHIFRTMDHGEFEKACMMAANLIGQIQSQTKKIRKNLDSPGGCVNTGGQSSININSKIKASINLHVSGVVLPVPALNYLGAGSLSDGRSNSAQETQHSRSSTKVPLVMRHCFHNNQEKKKLVEANKAVWLEKRRSNKARSPSPQSQLETITCRSPQSSYSGFENLARLKAKKQLINKKTLIRRSCSPKINLDCVIKPTKDLQAKNFQPLEDNKMKKSRNSVQTGFKTTQSDHHIKNKFSIYSSQLAEKLRTSLVKMKNNQIVEGCKSKAFSPLISKPDRAHRIGKNKIKSVITNQQTNIQVDVSKTDQKQRLAEKNEFSPNTEIQRFAKTTRNFKLPISSGNVLKTAPYQSVTPSSTTNSKRDSKLLLPFNQQNNKVVQLTRCTNSSLNPLANPIKQSCAPFSKSIVTSQSNYKTTNLGIIPSSLYLSTMSPVKSLNLDSKGEAAFETDSTTYPAVQTQTSCSKGEILLYTSAKATQMKVKQTFSSSLVTKSNTSKPISHKQSVNKHSHRKSSDYQFSSALRTPSLATAATGGKLGSGSFLITPNKVEPASAIISSSYAKIVNSSASQLKKPHLKQFKPTAIFGNSLHTQQKSRKYCKNILNGQSVNIDCSRQKIPLSPTAKQMPVSSPKACATTTKYLDTIESVECQSQMQICKLQNNSNNTENQLTVAVPKVPSKMVQPFSSSQQNSLYKLPPSAQSPVVINQRSEISLNAEDQQMGQIQSQYQQFKQRLTNSHNWKDLKQSQLESYSQRLHAKESLRLRSNNQKKEKSQRDVSRSLTLHQEGSTTPRADLLQEQGCNKLCEEQSQPVFCCSLLTQSLQKLSGTGTLEQWPIQQETHFKMAKAKIIQDKTSSQQELLMKQDSTNKKIQLSQDAKSTGFQQKNKIKSQSSQLLMETSATKSQEYGLNSYRKVAGFKQIETTGGVERNEELIQNNSSYFAAAAVKQVQQQQKQGQISSQEHSFNGREFSSKNLKPKMKSGKTSHQASMINLSMAKTESIAFQPSNPLKILRKMQRDQNYVWLATYDEDILHSGFMRKIGHCVDQCLPWEFVPWRLYDLQPFLINENCLCLRREPGKETLCKIYLVHIEQVKDIVRYKNHMCERKYLMSQGILIKEDEVQSMAQLREKYQVSKLRERVESLSPTTSSKDSLSYIPDERTVNSSIPDEASLKHSLEPSQNHYIVTMEGRREFDDLQDIENPPVLDLIYHEQTAMGLPIVFATNRDQSKLDDSIPVTPSYFKHLRSMKPDIQLLIKLLHGLIQSFPQYTAQQLMKNYIEQIPGITGKFSEEEIQEIIEKSINGISLCSEQPHTKLLSPEETSKMFELMNKQLDPNDLHHGYQSLSIYYEKQYQYDQVDRDVVFLGAESSEIIEQNDLSENQLHIIEQFNKDFQLQQQKFMLSSGYKNGIHGVYSSDTSQVDNFIFQNNINRFSNEVSRDFEDATPIRDGILARNTTNRLNMGTNAMQSRNASSHANRQESGNTTSYQGACRILNFQQPLFQGNQWNNNSAFGEDSAKEEEGPMNINKNNNRINRGSSLGLFSVLPSPPYKKTKQLNSASKPLIFSGKNSAIDKITDCSAFGGIKKLKKTIFTKHKQFNSNVPSSHRTQGYNLKQPGYEIPLEIDFVTNVESIKPLPNNNGSVCQASNSLFIQSGRSRNKDSSNIKKETNRKRLNIDPSNRFELSQEELEKRFIKAELPQEEFEEVICQGAASYQSQSTNQLQEVNQHHNEDLFANNPEVDVDSEDDDPVSIRQQLVSDLSVRKKRRASLSIGLNSRQPATDIDLDASRPEVELFEQVSDFVQKTGRHNLMQESKSSKELVLQENKASLVHSYRKVRHSLSKKIKMPFEQKQVKTEEKKMPTDMIENGPSFMEDAFDHMVQADIRRELFRSGSKEGMKN